MFNSQEFWGENKSTFGPLFPKGLFGSNLSERIFGDSTFQPTNLIKRYDNDDGSIIIEYSLAGFAAKEIKIVLDTKTNKLLISAESQEKTNNRSFSTTLPLNHDSSAKDITTSYKNGLLKIIINSPEEHKKEDLVDIPVTPSEDEDTK